MAIDFNVPYLSGYEKDFLIKAIDNGRFCGDQKFSKQLEEFFNIEMGRRLSLFTPSCTASLEMAALLTEIGPGDEIITPSFTFVSTVNPFVLRGARAKFVDIRPDTLNIDETLIEAAITPLTKAIIPVHYAGVSCEMDSILRIADKYGLKVIEDAAQGLFSYYKGRPLGTMGTIGCISFHETKNFHCGEGGLILVNDERLNERAEIIREKGTNRRKFLLGEVDKYTWVDIGSSYLASDLSAAFLLAQFQNHREANKSRLELWSLYHELLQPLERKGVVRIPHPPMECKHNAHIFYLLVNDLDKRNQLIDFLKKSDIRSTFHYLPLHQSPFGATIGEFVGIDSNTTRMAGALLRLPLHHRMRPSDVSYVSEQIYKFYQL